MIEIRGYRISTSQVSFAGRLLVASVFILSACQEFCVFLVEGGVLAKALGPILSKFIKIVSRFVMLYTGLPIPSIDVDQIIGTAIGLKAVGGLLFMFGSSLGSYILLLLQAISTVIWYREEKTESDYLFTQFTQGVALFGAMLYYVGMRSKLRTLINAQSQAKTTKRKTN